MLMSRLASWLLQAWSYLLGYLKKRDPPFSFFDIDLSRVWMANNPSFCHSQIPKGSEAKGTLKPENACSFSRIVSMIYHPIFAHWSEQLLKGQFLPIAVAAEAIENKLIIEKTRSEGLLTTTLLLLTFHLWASLLLWLWSWWIRFVNKTYCYPQNWRA